MRTSSRNNLVNNGRYALFLLSQSGETAPAGSSEINDFGTVTFARTSAGIYTITKTGAFTSKKTFVRFQNNVAADQTIKVVRTSANVITITTQVLSVDTGVLIATPTDGILDNTPFEIEVFN